MLKERNFTGVLCPSETTPDGKAAPLGTLENSGNCPEEGPTGEMSA